MNRLIIALITILFFIQSCETEYKKRKPSATGRANEMLVVIDKTHWEGKVGDIIKNAFASPQPMLPQPEAMFDLRPIEENNFSSLFETHRSILMVNIDPSLEKSIMKTKRDIWSYPQRVIKIDAPNHSLLELALEKNKQRLIDLYHETERKRLINAYRSMPNEEVKNTLRERFNISFALPKGYFIAKEENNFIWLRRTGTKEDLEMGLLLTILPYTSPEKDFDFDVIWKRRDSITKTHIPGEIPNSYMGTYEDLDPIYREINFNDKYAVELRGLWRMYGDFMGGPFINYTLVDEKTNRLINIDGFVWAPDFDKRDYLQQLEALAYSLEFTHNNKEDEEN